MMSIRYQVDNEFSLLNTFKLLFCNFASFLGIYVCYIQVAIIRLIGIFQVEKTVNFSLLFSYMKIRIFFLIVVKLFYW